MKALGLTLLGLVALNISFGAEPKQGMQNPTVLTKVGAVTTVVEYVPPVPAKCRVTVASSTKVSSKALTLWDVSPDDGVEYELEEPSKLVFLAPIGVEREYRIRWIAREPEGKQITERSTVKAGKGPKPPPGPTPDPDPDPTPDPNPTPPPFPMDGFRVLIVYQDSDELSYTSGQRAAIQSSEQIRNYLEAKCAPGDTATSWKEYRIYDVDVAGMMGGEPKRWQDAMARPRTKLPWIVISNGKTGFEGPLPEKLDETMKLLKKYGGE